MLTNHVKLIMGACLILGLLGCAGLTRLLTPTDNSSGQLPRRTAVITIDTSQQEKLFAQLRKFADKQGFTILIDTRPPGVEGFYIDMYRDDVEISGTNPFVSEKYELGIYDRDRQRPVSETVLDDLVNDLKSFVGEVPGATFSVE